MDNPAVPPAETSSPRWLLWSAIGLIFLVIGIAVGLFSAKFLNQSQLQSQLPPTQTATPSPPAVPPQEIDSTADWKTYTDKKDGYRFKYPSLFELTTLGESLPLLNRKIYWGTVPVSYIDCRGGCPIVTSTQQITINGILATKIKGWIGEIGGNYAQSYIKYEIKFPDQNSYFQISLWELPQNLKPNEIPSSDRKIQDISLDDERVFDQILSTFKFTE